MESLNSLAATLNAEKETIGDALDAVGPAVEVLSDQTDELVDMLGSLDRLGVVGTRVINASKDDVLAMLEELAPILSGLRGAGRQLAPGLNLLVSFPFPKAANSIVQGDYADTIARVQIDFTNLYTSIGLPDIQLPDPGEVLDQVGKCLRSGSITSKACLKVLKSVDLLKDLRKECKKKINRNSAVCQVVNSVPTLGDLTGGLLGDTLDGLSGGLNGLSRGLEGPAAASGDHGLADLLGGWT
jgi:phospholipid/cholesterol/gamma-HCH transport system substrate-binding protein